MVRIAVRLTADGWDKSVIYQRLRGMYPADGQDAIPDDEIWGVVNGVAKYENLSPGRTINGETQAGIVSTPVANARDMMEKFLDGFRCTESEVRAKSPVRIPASSLGQGGWFLLHLFEREDLINLVWEYRQTPNGRVSPVGFGKTHPRSYWLGFTFRDQLAVPQSEAGAWIRINPLDGQGISNRNVKAFRYCLVEFDSHPPSVQLAFFAQIKLPITALVCSGGKSIHAWVKVGAANARAYGEAVGRIYKQLAVFGIDQSNKNPSRLARLPGAVRKIGGTDGGVQRLLYLNPTPNGKGIFAN